MSNTSKTALVTGATRGIGRAIAEALLEQGAQVVGVYGGNRGAAAAMAKTAAASATGCACTNSTSATLLRPPPFFRRWRPTGTPWISSSTTPVSAATRCSP